MMVGVLYCYEVSSDRSGRLLPVDTETLTESLNVDDRQYQYLTGPFREGT